VNTIKEVRDYLKREQAIARYPDTPEWQVFTTLRNLAASCNSVDQFMKQARELPIDGPPEEVKEAQEWLAIALDKIAG
jgi:hypothetical protein